MLSQQQITNAKLIKQALIQAGITNELMQKAIIVICWKETGIEPIKEFCYSINNVVTPDYLRKIFGRLADKNDAFITDLTRDCKAFFNYVYSNMLGNDTTNGYLYRGRGYNQLTGKSSYITSGKEIGVDLAKNPDLVNKPEIAGKVLANFYKKINTNYSGWLNRNYGYRSLNQVNDLGKALQIAYHVTAGIGKTKNALFVVDSTGGWKKVKNNYKKVIDDLGKNNLFPILVLIAGVFFL